MTEVGLKPAITTALMDGELTHLQEELAALGFTINSMSHDEYMGKSKDIYAMKEYMRAIYNTLQLKNIAENSY